MIHDELAHTIKQIAAQASVEHRPWVYGHISNYNPANNSVRVIVPSMVDDTTGAPLQSGWLPLGGPWVGGGNTGLQIVPKGGTTAQKPTDGELCIVGLNERGTGVAAVLSLMYTDKHQPPHTALSSPLNPGELVFRHETGSLVRLHKNGDIEVTTGGDGAVTVTTSGKGGVTLTTTGQGAVTVNSAQPVVVTAPLTTVKGNLDVTGALRWGTGGTATTGSTHHHSGVATGVGQSGPPVAGT